MKKNAKMDWRAGVILSIAVVILIVALLTKLHVLPAACIWVSRVGILVAAIILLVMLSQPANKKTRK